MIPSHEHNNEKVAITTGASHTGDARCEGATMESIPTTEVSMSNIDEQMVLAHFIVSDDVERSRRFYTEVLGGKTVISSEAGDEVTYVALANSWIIINVGGGPTYDKPTVTLQTPPDPDRVSSFLNIRVADIEAVYAEWSARGAHFLTPPKQHETEIRCYIRDPDGYIIEVGQTTLAKRVASTNIRARVSHSELAAASSTSTRTDVASCGSYEIAWKASASARTAHAPGLDDERARTAATPRARYDSNRPDQGRVLASGSGGASMFAHPMGGRTFAGLLYHCCTVVTHTQKPVTRRTGKQRGRHLLVKWGSGVRVPAST